MDQAAIWSIWGPILTIALIFAVRFHRAGRERVLSPARMRVVPAIVVAVLGLVMSQLNPPLLGWLAFAVGAIVGTVIGWHRGKLIRLRRDVGTGAILQTVSPWAVLLLLVIVAVRFVIQREYGAGPPNRPASVPAIMVSDSLLGLAGALILVTRLEVALRVRALLRAG